MPLIADSNRRRPLRHRWLLAVLSAALMSLGAGSANAQSADADYSRKGADTCLSCHEDDVTLAVFRTAHAVPGDARGPFGHGQLQCEACHGPGDAHSGRVRRGQERPAIVSFSDTYPNEPAAENDMCLGCHSADIGFGWHDGSHSNDEVACADCHTSHAARDPVLHTSTQADVCYDCHQMQRSESMKAFAHPLFRRQDGLRIVPCATRRYGCIGFRSTDAERYLLPVPCRKTRTLRLGTRASQRRLRSVPRTARLESCGNVDATGPASVPGLSFAVGASECRTRC